MILDLVLSGCNWGGAVEEKSSQPNIDTISTTWVNTLYKRGRYFVNIADALEQKRSIDYFEGLHDAYDLNLIFG